jgi:hypothetical protein
MDHLQRVINCPLTLWMNFDDDRQTFIRSMTRCARSTGNGRAMPIAQSRPPFRVATQRSIPLSPQNQWPFNRVRLLTPKESLKVNKVMTNMSNGWHFSLGLVVQQWGFTHSNAVLQCLRDTSIKWKLISFWSVFLYTDTCSRLLTFHWTKIWTQHATKYCTELQFIEGNNQFIRP